MLALVSKTNLFLAARVDSCLNDSSSFQGELGTIDTPVPEQPS